MREKEAISLRVKDVRGLTVGSKPNQRTIRVLVSPEVGGADLTIIHTTFYAGANFLSEPHSHDTDEYMYVISGRGRATIGDKEVMLEPGVLLYAPAGEKHGAVSEGGEGLELLCVFYPPLKPIGYYKEAIELAKLKREGR